jgi:hypothetical protein
VHIVGIHILFNFDNNKNKAMMARAMPLFCIPSITKNVLTMLHLFPTSKIFFTKTSHSTRYESQKPPHYVVQVFHANGSQSLLTMLGKVQKTFSSSFKCYNLKIYGIRFFYIKFHIFPYFPSLVYLGVVFSVFLKKHSQGPLVVKIKN